MSDTEKHIQPKAKPPIPRHTLSLPLPTVAQPPTRCHHAHYPMQIHHIHQLLPVVRYWLPHVRIVQLKAGKEELVRGLRQALAVWGTTDMDTAIPTISY